MNESYQVADGLLSEIVDVIVREASPEKVVLFGSRARGDQRRQSDLDLLVVLPRPFGPELSRRRLAGRLWRALAGYPVPIDLLLYSRQEIESWSQSPGHVSTIALREGRVLYG